MSLEKKSEVKCIEDTIMYYNLKINQLPKFLKSNEFYNTTYDKCLNEMKMLWNIDKKMS